MHVQISLSTKLGFQKGPVRNDIKIVKKDQLSVNQCELLLQNGCLCSFKLRMNNRTIVKTKVELVFKHAGYLKCCNQVAVTDCVIAGVVVGIAGPRSPLLPDLGLYLENRTVVMG